MSFIKHVFIVSCVVGGVAFLLSLNVFKHQGDQFISYIPQSIKDRIFGSSESQFKGRLFTVEELGKYRGNDGGDIYLAVLGQVFDVTKGRKHYGPGGTYHFFTGE